VPTPTRLADRCLHPVLLERSIVGTTGWEEVRVPCGARQRARCEPCAEHYERDVLALIRRGLEGVPGVMLTLTAPGADVFGTWHHLPGKCHKARRCKRCGETVFCGQTHRPGDHRIGLPAHPGCFDHQAAAEWNRNVSRLRAATFRELNRQLHARGADPVCYLSVVEFQTRGLTHLHVLIRGGLPLDRDALEHVIAGARVVALDRLFAPPDGYVRWGKPDVQVFGKDDGPARRRVAKYVSKYVTKSLADPVDRDGGGPGGALVRHLRSIATAARPGECQHAARHLNLAACPWCRNRIRRLGYTGHTITKSHRWGSLAALRAEQQAWREAQPDYVPADPRQSWRRAQYQPEDDRAPPGSWPDLAMQPRPYGWAGIEVERAG
jgi:hypothetical protein